MKKLGLFSVLIAGLLYLSSCEKVKNGIVSISEVKDVITNEEGASLAKATYDGTEIPLRPIGGLPDPVSRVARPVSDAFVLEIQIASPSIDGDLLSATFVELSTKSNSTIAYVTYNLRGEKHGGALLVADLTNKNNPRILKEVIFEGIDLNVCELSDDNSMLWLGGSSFARGAVVIPVTLKADGDIESSNEYDLVSIEGVASVNGIIQTTEWLMVTAGNSGGGTFALNYTKGYRLDGTDNFANAKFSAANGQSAGNNHVSLEGGDSAKLHVYTIGSADEDIESVISVGSISHQNVGEYQSAGKATCFMEKGGDICYVGLGKNGFAAFDVKRRTRVMQSRKDMIMDGNTNAVTVDSKYIYLANGADGVVFCKKPRTSKNMSDVEVVPSFVWDDDLDVASANYVVSQGDYIFVAKGANGGLNVLKRVSR